MNLYDAIFQRKSCRKYDMTPLSDEVLEQVENEIKKLKPLYPNFEVKWHFSKKAKGKFCVDAPHYIIVSGDDRKGLQENVGFMFEQLVLWFDAMDLGCVWLGASKDAETKSQDDLIVIGFGRAIDSPHRTKNEFRRKPIEKITNTPQDLCMQAVHLAPSGMNTQPWYMEKFGDKVLVYKQKLKPPISFLYKLSDIDMGIALSHYYLTCKETGKEFNFKRTDELPNKQGYLPFGIINNNNL